MAQVPRSIQNLIEASIANNIDKVINISTDKAANPSNVMGATKLLGEKLIATASNRRPDRRTKFASVRFGNVLGSRGSVVPLFQSQIKTGKQVTITHLHMQRFIITVEQAVKLVLKAGQTMIGGEVFILKMPVIRIEDLADVLIEKYCKSEKVEKKFIGLRHGETLDEDILTNEESMRTLETEDMFIILPTTHFRKVNYKYPNAKIIPDGYTYSSSTQEPISKEALASIIEKL